MKCPVDPYDGDKFNFFYILSLYTEYCQKTRSCEYVLEKFKEFNFINKLENFSSLYFSNPEEFNREVLDKYIPTGYIDLEVPLEFIMECNPLTVKMAEMI